MMQKREAEPSFAKTCFLKFGSLCLAQEVLLIISQLLPLPPPKIPTDEMYAAELNIVRIV